jgi:hypothetical protein
MLKKTNRYNRHSWVAFEASVLVQQTFESIAIPFAGSAKLDWYLKLLNKRVLDNDICHWAWWSARARVENNSDQLSEADLEMILNDAESSQELRNPFLLTWFSEPDAVWLDNVRSNIDTIASESRKSLAILAGIMVGDYALSFDSETQSLRRPLSDVYSDLLNVVNRVIDNQRHNFSSNYEAHEFIIRTKADLLYANLPAPGSMLGFLESDRCWRESWVRGRGDIYAELFPRVKESFGGMVASKERYLQLLADLLERSKHMPKWAIGFQEGQPASMNEIAEVVRRYRPLQATYLKDMSDIIGGAKAYIIVAGSQ